MMQFIRARWRNAFFRIALACISWRIFAAWCYAGLTHIDPRFVYSMLSRQMAFFLIARLAEPLCMIFIVAVMLRAERKPFSRSLGLQRPGALKQTVMGLFIGLAMMLLYVGFAIANGWYSFSKINHAFRWLYTFVYVGVPAAGEEILFRGYIFRELEERSGATSAIIVSSVLFGLGHVVEPFLYAWNHDIAWGQSLNIFLRPFLNGLTGGLIYACAFNLTRRLWLSIGIHWAWNFGGVLFFYSSSIGIGPYLLSRIDHPRYSISGPMYWVSIAISLAVAAVLAMLARRKHRRLTGDDSKLPAAPSQ